MKDTNALYKKAWDEAMLAIAEFGSSDKSHHTAAWTLGRINGIRALACWIDSHAYWSDWHKWEQLTQKIITRDDHKLER